MTQNLLAHLIFISVKNRTPQEKREERVFIVFPEPSNSFLTEATPEAKKTIDEDITTVSPHSDESTEEEEEDEETEGEAQEEIDGEDVDEDEAGDVEEEDVDDEDENIQAIVSAARVESRSDIGAGLPKTVNAPTTTAEPTTTTMPPTSTPTTTTQSTSTTSTTTPAPSSTSRMYRGTPRAPKTKFSTSTAAPVTTAKAPTQNATTTTPEDSSFSESDESKESKKESTTHKTPHFEVAKKENVLKPATRPSARLVSFLKKKTPGNGKRYQLHPTSSENATITESSTTVSSTAATTTTSTAAPDTTTRTRRTGAEGSRGKTKMLDKVASEIHAVSVPPPETSIEMRRARFFSSASSMLSGFVPAVPMQRPPSQTVNRNSRASCANPAGCISPENAEVLMIAAQESIKNNTLTRTQPTVTDTASAVRNKIQSRRNNPPMRRTTAAPLLTTREVVTLKPNAMRLGQRRRPEAPTSTAMPTVASSAATTAATPSIVTMRQIHDIVVTPAPIMVAHGHDQTVVQEPITFKPIFQRFKGLQEKRIHPVHQMHAQVRPQMQSVTIN